MLGVITIALFMGEGLLILKNKDMKNYDIEMWRYAKLITQRSSDPILGHEHRRNRKATLQSVQIRTNNFGLRGPDIDINPSVERRILFLGSSATLGWGVSEPETLPSILDDRLGDRIEVLNGGICNYNTVRYVELFMKKLTVLNPTDIVLHYFINDTEVLSPVQANWFIRHSQFAVTLWQILNRVIKKNIELNTLSYYKGLYQKNAPGYEAMRNALDRIKTYADKKNIRIFLLISPDYYNLADYQYEFIHSIMKQEASIRGFKFIDLLYAFKGEEITNPRSFWAMDNDPHPNGAANQLMADYLLRNAFFTN